MIGIGLKIKELRIERNLSQTDLAKIFYTSQDTISLWENEKALPDLKSLILICKFFNVSADYLLGLKDY